MSPPAFTYELPMITFYGSKRNEGWESETHPLDENHVFH